MSVAKTTKQFTDAELEKQLSELSAFANAAAANGVTVPKEMEAQFVELDSERKRRLKGRAVQSTR